MARLVPDQGDEAWDEPERVVRRSPEAAHRPGSLRRHLPVPGMTPFWRAVAPWRQGTTFAGQPALSTAAFAADASATGSPEASAAVAPGPVADPPVTSASAGPASARTLTRPLEFAGRFPLWSLALVLLLLGSLIYTYAGTLSRETYRTAWLPETSVPFTLDGMAFMKTAYPGEYRAINWLNAHVAGAQVIAEADGAYYDWRSRVSMFTGLPDIINGIHEGEQRYDDEVSARSGVVSQLYNTTDTSAAWHLIRTYGVRWIYVGFSERQCVPGKQCYAKAGLAKFQRMVGHGLAVAYRRDGVTIYRVTRP
jgi:hypothetical protein